MNYPLQIGDKSFTPDLIVSLTATRGPTEVVHIPYIAVTALTEEWDHVFEKMESMIAKHPEAILASIVLVREVKRYASPSKVSTAAETLHNRCDDEEEKPESFFQHQSLLFSFSFTFSLPTLISASVSSSSADEKSLRMSISSVESVSSVMMLISSASDALRSLPLTSFQLSTTAHAGPHDFVRLLLLAGNSRRISIAEKNLASVVVVPLKALSDELRARFEDKGLLILTWSPGIKTYDAGTIFVSVEQLECSSFFDYLREGVQKGALSRIVIDESHYASTSKHYKPCLLLMPRLRQLPLQIVASTATLPPATIPRFLQHFQMLSGATEIIRGDTTRKDISFNAFTIVAVGAGALRVLYTTSALSAGLDIRDIQAVVHLRKPSNMLDYGQGFGRGCRDGKPGWSFVFHDPKQKPFTLQAGQDDTGVSEMASWLSVPACRRIGLSLFFDGRTSSCLEMVTVQLCDICQMMVAKSIYDPSLAMLPAPEPAPSVLHQLRLAAPPRPLLPAPPLQLGLLQFPTRPQHAAPPMRLPVPPQPPIQPLHPNSKSESSNRSNRLQDIMSSLAVDQRQYMNQQLLSFKKVFSPGLLCATCWVAATRPSDHGNPTCCSRNFIVSHVAFLKEGLYIPTMFIGSPAPW
ncbi:P-loop containing nucleoside triphosphate hydrolase protein [Suillus fuscotomentosus]|uniref:DNA 3'-5' helicase n=1 Tax=Suillus fuscotomentosus TaxID=1912939 RepID=A0AAD4HCW0_9AGAM|nr:P-loop containing nucleoside triphosphate hydrolase protein [Suillus fuscotomentosus]KAG1887991.1 P-loop containing nucleoside triphosphate hydrolase protein [Suillus fuscotomentosus]